MLDYHYIMKALVLEADKQLKVKDIPIPPKEEDKQILVRVNHAGICGSDIARGFGGKAYHYPLVMGHEFSGIVEEAPDESSHKKGDRVTVFPLLPCMKCISCQTGNYAQCLNYDYYGSRRDGAFAEYLRVPEMNVFPLPDHVDLLSAAMTEPCAVALHGVEKLRVEAGMSGLVIGGGPVGNMTAQWLRLKGIDPLYVADVDEKKLALVEDLGLKPINSARVDLAEHVRRLEASGGIDCCVEACGLPLTFVQAIECTARFGQVVFMGNINGTFSLEEKKFSNILRNEITIYGTWNAKITPRGKDDWSRVLKFMDEDILVQALVSHQPSLEEGPEIFQKIVSRSEWYNKIVFSI